MLPFVYHKQKYLGGHIQKLNPRKFFDLSARLYERFGLVLAQVTGQPVLKKIIFHRKSQPEI